MRSCATGCASSAAPIPKRRTRPRKSSASPAMAPPHAACNRSSSAPRSAACSKVVTTSPLRTSAPWLTPPCATASSSASKPTPRASPPTSSSTTSSPPRPRNSVPQTLLEGTLARRLERLSLVSRKRLVGQGQGDRRSLRKGSSLEFADYRHYVEGDDPARVDWNIYSRTDTLFVRLYEEEEVLNVHLVLDASRSMDWGEPSKLRYARRLAAALGYVALNAANRLFIWPLSATNNTFGPAWGRGRAGPMLDRK